MNGKQRRAQKRNAMAEVVKAVETALTTAGLIPSLETRGAVKRTKHKQPHTSAPRGKKILVEMKDGETFTDKFIERRPKHVVFEGRTVRAGDIKRFSINRKDQE